ncbi:MAG: DUF2723 domain-containing protein [Chloroflexi bacterium]|nr:DUF2723 domain-containing protein [Chloroflexota bacterium]
MTAATSSKPISRDDLLVAALIWLSAFALYVRTLAPSLLWGDSAEFQVLSYTLGMTHPSGYTTQIILGKFFTLIPLGNIAWRVNLMSAFFGAFAAAQVYLIVRMFNRWRVAAVAASALLALSEGFWWRALVAESYATAASMIASVWLLTLLWNRSGKWQYLFLAGLLGGLSVGIHSTVVMTAASVLVIMTLAARKRADWLGASAGALIGLALTLATFLYVDAHDPPSSIYNTVYRPSLSALGLTETQFDTPFERLFAIFPANHFWDYYFSAPPEVIRARLVEYAGIYPLWAAAFIVVGIVALFRRPTWHDGLYPLVSFLLIWGLGVTVAFSIYREFYVPAAIFIAGWLGAGIGIILDGLDSLLQREHVTRRVARPIILAASFLTFILLPFSDAYANLQLAVTKGYTDFIRRDHIYPIFAPDKAINDARKLLERVEPNAIIFTDWDNLYSAIYTAQLVMDRDDITLHEAFIGEQPRFADSAIAYINANINERPIYFTLWLDNLEEHFTVEVIDEGLYRIRGK